MAACFGFFQAIMPVMGWVTGTGFRDAVSSVDHWVAFDLLSLVGGEMSHESVRSGPTKGSQELISTSILLVLSLRVLML